MSNYIILPRQNPIGLSILYIAFATFSKKNKFPIGSGIGIPIGKFLSYGNPL